VGHAVAVEVEVHAALGVGEAEAVARHVNDDGTVVAAHLGRLARLGEGTFLIRRAGHSKPRPAFRAATAAAAAADRHAAVLPVVIVAIGAAVGLRVGRVMHDGAAALIAHPAPRALRRARPEGLATLIRFRLRVGVAGGRRRGCRRGCRRWVW